VTSAYGGAPPKKIVIKKDPKSDNSMALYEDSGQSPVVNNTMHETVNSFHSRRHTSLEPLSATPRIPSANESQKSYTQRVLESTHTKNKQVLAPLGAPQLDGNVSDDEPPNYLNVLEDHHSQQRKEFEERKKQKPALGADLDDRSETPHSSLQEDGVPKKKILKKKKKGPKPAENAAADGI
jgi:hypothetical protein